MNFAKLTLKYEQAFAYLNPDLVKKMLTFIDIQKIKGLTGGQASSRFGDYLGFLGIADTEEMQFFFAERWTDNRVWITIPKEYEKYLDSETPILTPHRLEPVYNLVPASQQGITKTDPGNNRNPENKGSVRKAPGLTEDYSNFIVHEYLPDHFFLEVANETLQSVLSSGLPSTNYEKPYKLYSNVHEARTSLIKDLVNRGSKANHNELSKYTLLALSTSDLELSNDVFYTKKISGHKGRGRNSGYYYTGSVKAKGLRVASANIAN